MREKKLLKVPLLFLAFIATPILVEAWPATVALANRGVSLSPPTSPIPATFMSMNISRTTWAEPVPPDSVKSWRSFDAAWYKVEPEKGQWKFQHPDITVQEAQAKGVDVDFVLTTSPTWASARPDESVIRPYFPKGMRAEPAQLEDWVNYVRTVALHYKGKVHTYELWNEANLSDWYSGDVDHMRALCQAAYTTLKSVDPSITVISPGFSPERNQGFIKEFLAGGSYNTFDVLGYHAYTQSSTPEQEILLLQQFEGLAPPSIVDTVPLWNTESGYIVLSGPTAKTNNANLVPDHVHPLSLEESEAFLVRAYLLGWGLHFQRYYWFCWGSDQYAVVDDHGYTAKPTMQAYSNLAAYLIGSSMKSCHRTPDGVWTVELVDKSNERFEVAWSDSGSRTFSVPSRWNAGKVETVLGQQIPLQPEMQLAGTPYFFR